MTTKNDQEFFNANGSGTSNGHYRGETPIDASHSQQNEEEIDLRQVIAVLLHNRWLVASITGALTIAAIIFSLLQMPIFESSGTIIITSAGNRYSMAGNDISNLLMSSYGIGVGSSIDNEIEILNSRTLAFSLAKKMYQEKFDYYGRIYPILWRDYPKDSTLTTADTVAVRIMKGRFIEQKGKLSGIVNVKFESPSPYEAMRIVNLIIDTYSEASTSSNRVQARAALDFLSNELKNVKEEVRVNEELMRDFMNDEKIVQLDAQTNELVNTLSKLESEKQVINVKLVAIQEGIKSANQEFELLKPGLSQQLNSTVAPLLQRLQVQIAELETERILILSKNPEVVNNPDLVPRLKQVENQIASIKNQVDLATKNILAEGNTQLLGFLESTDGGIVKRIVDIKQKLLEFQVQELQYKAQLQLLGKQIDTYNTFFNNLPDNMIKMARIKRDLQISEQLYLTLAKQSAEMALWEQTQSGLARVVDQAYYPLDPIRPKKKIMVIIGFIVGLVISFGLVFIKELSKKEIDSVEKLRKKGMPILSVIPDLNPYIEQHFDGEELVEVGGQKISTGLVTLLDSISPSAESYRRLQSNIMYSKPDDPYKVILVTSSNKSEGKTTLSANLAISMAETGNRVLLVDCDFRRPRIHSIFGFSASPGLVDLLFEDSDPHQFIHQTLVENVFVLTAGNRPPNPAEINRSRKLRNLIAKLRYEFDYVILDTPPYGIITDAAPLIKLADGIVVVAKFNQTKEGELDHTLDSLNRINANIIGACMTAFDPKKTSGYYYTDYYYQYSYESYKDYDKREA